MCVGRVAGEHAVTSLLDLGCREADLRSWVPGLQRYVGVDFVQNQARTVDLICDLSLGIPLADASFDAVAALDLLEHLDDMSGLLDEIARVSARLIIVALPNLAHVAFRLAFLLGGRVSAKYDLRYGYGKDRHRWLTVIPQTDAFVEAFAAARGYKLSRIDLGSPARRHRAVELLLRALRCGRAWHVYRTVYVLEKIPGADARHARVTAAPADAQAGSA